MSAHKYILVGVLLMISGPFGVALPGFYHPKHAPEAVQKLIPSTYRIVFHQPKPIAIVAEAQFDLFKNSIPQAFGGMERYWRELELNHLFESDHGLLYPVAFSTGTLIRDQKTLVTSRHPIQALPGIVPESYQDADDYLQAKKSLADFSLMVVIIDHKGDIVFETRTTAAKEAGHSVTIGFNGHPSFTKKMGLPFSEMEVSTATEFTDLIEIKLSHPLKGPPIQVANTPPALGDRIYSLNYPFISNNRQKEHKVPDSDGKQLRLSVGKVIPLPKFYSEFLSTLDQSEKAMNAYIEHRLFTDLDMVHGSSGAAVVNKDGELVGIYGGHWNETEPRKVPLEEKYSSKGGHALSGKLIERLLDL